MFGLRCFKLVFILSSFILSGCRDYLSHEFLEEITCESDDILNPSAEYIAVLGDIQTYTSYYPSFLMMSTYWLRYQQEKYNNIRALVQVGDISETNHQKEYRKYQSSISLLNGYMPIVTVTGNHDYDWSDHEIILSRESTYLTQFVSNTLLEDNIVMRYQPDKLDNIVVKLVIQGQRIDIIALEFAPRREVVAWADSLVRSNPDQKYILLTHEFLYKRKRVDKESYAEKHFPDGRGCSPEEIWQSLVYYNDNIISVLCGHNGYSEQYYSENSAGRMVPQILFNLQYQDNGGDSEIELWEFPEKGDSVNVFVYNPGKRSISDREFTRFSFRYRY